MRGFVPEAAFGAKPGIECPLLGSGSSIGDDLADERAEVNRRNKVPGGFRGQVKSGAEHLWTTKCGALCRFLRARMGAVGAEATHLPNYNWR